LFGTTGIGIINFLRRNQASDLEVFDLVRLMGLDTFWFLIVWLLE